MVQLTNISFYKFEGVKVSHVSQGNVKKLNPEICLDLKTRIIGPFYSPDVKHEHWMYLTHIPYIRGTYFICERPHTERSS